MIGQDSKQLVITQIKNILKGKNKKENMKILYGKLVQTGKVPSSEIDKLINMRVDFETEDVNYLCLIYTTLQQFNVELKANTTYFTPLEIENSERYIIKRQNGMFPLVFNNVVKTTENGKEYKFMIPIQQVRNLNQAGVFKIIQGMQRETETVNYRGQLETHVKFNPNVVDEIKNCILNGTYHPTDEIKINYNGEDYEINDDTITINSGDFALLDGQHRVMAIESAMMENENIYMMISFNLSFGSEKYAQELIEQHERRQPISKKVLSTYSNSIENEIFRKFSKDEDIESHFKFIETPQAENSNLGFMIKSDIIEGIRKYYKLSNKTKTKDKLEVTKWLVFFFETYYMEFEDDIENFKTVKKSKWNVRSWTIDGLMYMSYLLYKTDKTVEEKLQLETEILQLIDFTSEIKSTNKSRECLNIIKEVVDSYVE